MTLLLPAHGLPVFLEALGDRPLQRRIAEWAATDAAAASEWLSLQPPSAARDSAAMAFAQTIQVFDQAAAIAWLRGIAPSTERDAILAQWGTEN